MSERQGNPLVVPLLLALTLAVGGLLWFGTRHKPTAVKGTEPAAAPSTQSAPAPAEEKAPPAKKESSPGVIVG